MDDSGDISDSQEFRALFDRQCISMSAAGPGPVRTLVKLAAVLVCVSLLAATALLPYVGGLGLAADRAANRFLARPCDLQQTRPPQRTTVYANDGRTVIATLFTQDREPVPLSDVPAILRRALIATEDRRFYSHHGVDLRGLIRSAVRTSSGSVQGGSTLTMQYAKEERFYQARNDAERQAAVDQNLERKIQDARCALYFENTLNQSKAQILSKYLNITFFGENSYGVQTAAQRYFGVPDVSQLKPWQSAMLVGLIKSPTQYDPYGNNGRNAVATRQRRNEVIANLVAVGAISPARARTWQAQPLGLAARRPPIVQEGCAQTIANRAVANAGFFCDYLTSWLEDPHRGGLSDRQLRQGGLKVISTLNVRSQNRAQATVSHIPARSATTAVMPQLDPKTGRILAMATSKHYGVRADGAHTVVPIFTQSEVNGSSTFELFTLLAALSLGADASLRYSAQTDEHGKLYYSPLACLGSVSRFYNSGRAPFTPDETLASAVAKSSTTYFVALEDEFFRKCDLAPSVRIALRLGISALRRPVSSGGRTMTRAAQIVEDHEASFALGPYQTNPLELTAAYATVADGGVRHPPTPVLAVIGPDGRPLAIQAQRAVRVLTPQTASDAMNLLSGYTDPGAQGATGDQFRAWYAHDKWPIAGAGATNAASSARPGQQPPNSSAWFVGATPRLTASTLLMNLARPSAPLAPGPGPSGGGLARPDERLAAAYWLAAVVPGLHRQFWQWYRTVHRAAS
jgi:membrane peptidoglycan carboxypeptidase